jgi:hypothetical protein
LGVLFFADCKLLFQPFLFVLVFYVSPDHLKRSTRQLRNSHSHRWPGFLCMLLPESVQPALGNDIWEPR